MGFYDIEVVVNKLVLSELILLDFCQGRMLFKVEFLVMEKELGNLALNHMVKDVQVLLVLLVGSQEAQLWIFGFLLLVLGNYSEGLLILVQNWVLNDLVLFIEHRLLFEDSNGLVRIARIGVENLELGGQVFHFLVQLEPGTWSQLAVQDLVLLVGL